MSLAPISPVSRRGQWRDVLRIADQSSGEFMNIAGYTFQIDIAAADEREFGSCCDYGRRFLGRDDPGPRLSIKTNAENTGSLVKADDYTLLFAFSRDQMRSLSPGSYCRSVLASIGDEVDEVQREFFTVS